MLKIDFTIDDAFLSQLAIWKFYGAIISTQKVDLLSIYDTSVFNKFYCSPKKREHKKEDVQ